jgi:hypothetical protein
MNEKKYPVEKAKGSAENYTECGSLIVDAGFSILATAFMC